MMYDHRKKLRHYISNVNLKTVQCYILNIDHGKLIFLLAGCVCLHLVNPLNREPLNNKNNFSGRSDTCLFIKFSGGL